MIVDNKLKIIKQDNNFIIVHSFKYYTIIYDKLIQFIVVLLLLLQVKYNAFK